MKKVFIFLSFLFVFIGITSCSATIEINEESSSALESSASSSSEASVESTYSSISSSSSSSTSSAVSSETISSIASSSTTSSTTVSSTTSVSTQDPTVNVAYQSNYMKGNASYSATKTHVIICGDLTVCGYATDGGYSTIRDGYGTRICEYMQTKVDGTAVQFCNFALSGRSSRSFTGVDSVNKSNEANYQAMVNAIQPGDYLIIGFGHNDEKTDVATTGTYPGLAITDNTSFQYWLYNYYVKVALDKGATPILVTPIVRYNASGSYSGSSIHVTSNGDYSQCIRDLGTAKSVSVIDLTNLTKDLYTTLGTDAAKFHAIEAGKTYPDIDKTHTNYYGAEMNAYLFCNALSTSSSTLASFVKSGITQPTIA